MVEGDNQCSQTVFLKIWHSLEYCGEQACACIHRDMCVYVYVHIFAYINVHISLKLYICIHIYRESCKYIAIHLDIEL